MASMAIPIAKSTTRNWPGSSVLPLVRHFVQSVPRSIASGPGDTSGIGRWHASDSGVQTIEYRTQPPNRYLKPSKTTKNARTGWKRERKTRKQEEQGLVATSSPDLQRLTAEQAVLSRACSTNTRSGKAGGGDFLREERKPTLLESSADLYPPNH